MERLLGKSNDIILEDSAISINDPKKVSDSFKYILYTILGLGVVGLFTNFNVFVQLCSIIFFPLLIIGTVRPTLGLFSISILFTLAPVIQVYVLGGGILRWNSINYWLLIYIAINHKYLLSNMSKMIVAGTIFLITLVLQLTYTTDLVRGSQHILGFISFFGFYTYLITIKRENSIKILTETALLIGITTFLSGALFFFHNGLAAFDADYYFKQGFSIDEIDVMNANAFAAMLTSSIILAAVIYGFAPTKRDKRLILLFVLLNTTLILFSGSRGSLLVSLFSIYFIISNKKSLTRLVITLFIMYLALLASLPILEQSDNLIAEKIVVLFDENATAGTKTNGRSDIARVGFEIFKENPLGVGTGSFSTYFARYSISVDFDLSGRLEQSQVAAHSGLVKIMAENGIIGIITFGAFILSFLYNKRHPNYSNGIFTIVISLVTFLSTEFQNKPVWMICAVVAYYGLILNDKQYNHIAKRTS